MKFESFVGEFRTTVGFVALIKLVKFTLLELTVLSPNQTSAVKLAKLVKFPLPKVATK